MPKVTSPCLVCIFVNIQSISVKFRPDDSTVMISLACGSLSGVASSTGKCLWIVAISPVSVFQFSAFLLNIILDNRLHILFQI